MARNVRFYAFLRAASAKVREFFSEVPGALKNHLNAQELSRVIVAALSAGTGVYGVLQGVLVSAGTVFPAPTDAALAATALATILEVLRRLPQGDPVGRIVAVHRQRD